jgi:hypothetical protein
MRKQFFTKLNLATPKESFPKVLRALCGLVANAFAAKRQKKRFLLSLSNSCVVNNPFNFVFTQHGSLKVDRYLCCKTKSLTIKI